MQGNGQNYLRCPSLVCGLFMFVISLDLLVLPLPRSIQNRVPVSRLVNLVPNVDPQVCQRCQMKLKQSSNQMLVRTHNFLSFFFITNLVCSLDGLVRQHHGIHLQIPHGLVGWSRLPGLEGPNSQLLKHIQLHLVKNIILMFFKLHKNLQSNKRQYAHLILLHYNNQMSYIVALNCSCTLFSNLHNLCIQEQRVNERLHR